MRCTKCQHENRKEAKFCEECGTELAIVCTVCGKVLRPEAKFCDECGISLVAPKPEHNSVEQDLDISGRQIHDAERRQITVLFCDLVGSTPLSEKLEPEKLRDLLHDYQSVCAKVIRRFEGHIARYLGDGILVYFGYPMAHEDDAQRSVRAGLGIVEGLCRLNAQNEFECKPLEVRIGIHTGLVIAGDMDENEQLESMAIVGETPNIAARLQNLAEPNTVIISSATHHLIQGYFNCNSLGSHSLEGFSRQIEVYQVLHESGARTRLDTAKSTGLTPLVGRDQELSLLVDRWKRVKERKGHVAIISGEPGIGKSRLVQMLKEYIAKDSQAWLIECHCSPYHQNTAFYPVIDLFENVILQFDNDDSSQEKLSKIEGFLVQYGLPLNETVPLFAILLSIPLSDIYPPLNLNPKHQKQKILQSLLNILMKRALQQPTLFVVEDLHWADPSSLELLNLLVDQGPTVPIFTVVTSRQVLIPTWAGRSHLTYITLNRLVPEQIKDIAGHIAGKTLPDKVLEQIVDKTDGVPLFVEELTKTLLESGMLKEIDDRYELNEASYSLAIPATLHDSLMARLDRLAEVKEVAQLGATIGREFSYDLLQAVSTLNEDALQGALAQLVDAELLFQRGLPPQATYLFKHSLIRDTAYESLLKNRRQRYHQKIAQTLGKEFPEIAKIQPEILAYHYTSAGLYKQAIPYWHQAGQQAIQHSANVEAISHLTQGLNLLKDLPETTERIQYELGLQIALGPALIAIKGYASPEVEAVFTRALELCQKLGEVPQMFPVLWGLYGFYLLKGELRKSRQIGEQFLQIAQIKQDPMHLMEAYENMGVCLYHLGDFVSALDYLERSVSLYDPQHYSFHIYGRHSGIHCLYYKACILANLGYPEKALTTVNEALKMARELQHPHTLAMALTYTAYVYQVRGEAKLVQQCAEEEMAISIENNFPHWLATGAIFHGWAIAEQGEIKDGIEQMQQGLGAWHATGSELAVPYFYSLLAEILGKASQIKEGLATLDDAMTISHRTGDQYYEAETCRIKGELMLLNEADNVEIESLFNKAMDLARQQQARLFQLRAAISLSRLWQKQGKKSEAQQMLQEIYDWFTEGLNIKDLQKAKELLEEL